MATRDPKTEALRVRIYRAMTPEQRIAIAARLFEDGVAIVRASILDAEPDIDDETLRQRVRERVLPRGLAREVREAMVRRGGE